MENQDQEKIKDHEHRHTVVETTIPFILEELKDIKTNHLDGLNKKFNWMIGIMITLLMGIIFVLFELLSNK